jgi:hypothetical protein
MRRGGVANGCAIGETVVLQPQPLRSGERDERASNDTTERVPLMLHAA